MTLSHVTIQTSIFAEEIDFYATYGGLAIQREMRPMGANMFPAPRRVAPAGNALAGVGILGGVGEVLPG